MAKKFRLPEREPSQPCPRCGQLEDELARSEQRSFERLREITELVNGLEQQQRAEGQLREEALGRLAALRERLSAP